MTFMVKIFFAKKKEISGSKFVSSEIWCYLIRSGILFFEDHTVMPQYRDAEI